MPASPHPQSKPPPSKNTIRRFRTRDDNPNPNPNPNPSPNPNPNPSPNPSPSPNPTPNSNQRDGSVEEELGKLARFGPSYGDDTEANRKAKDSAWKHILQKSGSNETENIYLSSMMAIENEAMGSYECSIVDELRQVPKKFRRMMMMDGCFFLQLALHILGAREHLEYPKQHPYFGSDSDSSSWIPAMFFVGNQIPCAVIDALMKQAFFQNVIKKGIEKGTWQRPTEDLAKLVLYLTVVEPQLDPSSKATESREPPSNILNSLHNLLLGSGHDNDPTYSQMREFHDLEAGNDDSKIKIPSAEELHKSGIYVTKGKAEKGIGNIHFKNCGYCAFLYLPPLTIDRHTKHLLASLANHELNLNESDREVTAYLRFLRDLVRTYKDFKILEKQGIIIQGKDKKSKGTPMGHMLDHLVSAHKSNYTLKFQDIARQITEYGGPPWRLISFIAVLAIVQTVFTVVAYLFPRKSS